MIRDEWSRDRFAAHWVYGRVNAMKMKAVAINAAMIVAFAAAAYAATVLVLAIHLC